MSTPQNAQASATQCFDWVKSMCSLPVRAQHLAHFSATSKSSSLPQYVVLVDPYSTGGMLAPELARRGYSVIALWTNEVGENRGHLPQAATGFPERFFAEVDECSTLSATAAALQSVVAGADLVALICGGETGVKVADALSEHMGLRGNSTSNGMANRRDKNVQQAAVNASGLRSVRSACGTLWGDVEAFCGTEKFPIIVKPVESAGSDGVKLCRTVEEARIHFDLLMGSQQKCGAQGAAVLLQEFLKGEEYIVDMVTRNGVHKATLIWKYDRRSANGGDFVNFGQMCIPSDTPEAKQLVTYTRGVLDALRITAGATHTEVMMTTTGPCLIEVNGRCHGAAGAWMPLAKALTGYTQVEACVDAFLDADAFDKLPGVPLSPFLAAGQVVMLISFHRGTVEDTPGYERVRSMKSYVSLETMVKPGDTLERTVDLWGVTGMCVLVHEDSEVLRADIDAIRKMEVAGSLFALSNELNQCASTEA